MNTKQTIQLLRKRIIVFLTLCLLPLVSTLAKDRGPAPEVITNATPVVGNQYYLYNVGVGMFLNAEAGNQPYATLSNIPTFIEIRESSSSGWYRLFFVVNSCYLDSGKSDYYMHPSSSTGHSYHMYSFQAVEGGYKLINYNYQNNFIGKNSSSYHITNLTDGDIWQLYTANSERDLLKYFLYQALETSDNYDFDVSKYETIYESDTCSFEEINFAIQELTNRNALAKVIADNKAIYGNLLQKWETILYNASNDAEQFNDAALELQRSIEFTNTLTFQSENEYTVLITRTSPNWKIRKDASNQVALQNYGSFPDNWDYITSYNNDPSIRNSGGTWDLPITILVNETAIFSFNYYCSGNYGNPILALTHNNKLIREVPYNEGNQSKRYDIVLTPGINTITIQINREDFYNSYYATYINIYDLRLFKVGEEICVDVPEAGELAAELLNQVDDIQKINRLKVRGPMNDEDWAPIYTMNKLFSLDLSETNITKIKDQQLSAEKYSSLSYLNIVKLPNMLKIVGEKAFKNTPISSIPFPNTLTTIGAYAFSNTCIDKVSLPQSVNNIGDDAFANCSSLESVVLPDSVTLGTSVFYQDSKLKTVHLPNTMTIVPNSMFYQCTALDSVVLGNNVKQIGSSAFYQCNALKTINFPTTLEEIGSSTFYGCTNLKFSTLPTIKTIGSEAFRSCSGLDTLSISDKTTIGGNYVFRDCSGLKVINIGKDCSLGQQTFYNCSALDSVVIGEGTTLGNQVFYYCTNLRHVEFPTTYYTCSNQQLYEVRGNKLKNVIFKSPSVVQGSAYQSFFSNTDTDSLTIYVPSFQLTNYKLDSYWYNFNLKGFDTDAIGDWTINAPMTLSSTNRFNGEPNLTINEGGSLRVSGTVAQNINDLTTRRNGNNAAMILSRCDNIHIDGSYFHDHYTARNTWNFLTMPFDFRVGDVTSLAEAQMVIRRYNGAHRATSGTGNNWQNYANNDTVKAGEGFILMTSRDGWVRFTALNTDSKQNAVRNQTLSKFLEENPSSTSANRGWNLVGNMFMTYYDGHKLGFTAPFTTWTGSTYKAYSVADDDYAIKPTEAFFVQRPNDADNISFPTEGRQLTSVIVNDNNVKAMYPMAKKRWIVNLALSTYSIDDETRIVINNNASLDYETTCDAGKFMSLDAYTPQIWTIGNTASTQFAINERPLADGIVAIGLNTPKAGMYTISAQRNDVGKIELIDKLQDITTDLSASSYTFYAESGVVADRFELCISDDKVTDVQALTATATQRTTIYTLDGRLIGAMPANGLKVLPKGIYLIKRGKQTQKVTIK